MERYLPHSQLNGDIGLTRERANASPAQPLAWYSTLDPTHLYSVPELAEATNLSADLIRKIFTDDPDGILVVERPEIIRAKKKKRIYTTYRIPGSVAIFKFKSMTKGGAS